MLKKIINTFNYNIFDELNKKTPILTCGDYENGFNSMVVSWGGIGVLWGKNVAYIFVRHSRYTFEYIEKSDSVTLSFLNDNYKEQKKIFGTKSGRDLDKFNESGLHATYDVDFNGYYVCESDYVLKMKKLYSVDLPYEQLPKAITDRFYANGDMHRMYVCEIVQYLENEE